MAYNAVVSVSLKGAGVYYVSIEETDCGPSDATPIPEGLPPLFKVIRMQATLTSGAAGGITPRLVNGTGKIVVLASGSTTPQDYVCPVPFWDDSAVDGYANLIHQSAPNTGTNNVISTFYLIQEMD